MSGAQGMGADPLIERLTMFRERALREQGELSESLEELKSLLGAEQAPGDAQATVSLDTRGFPTAIDLSVEGSPTADQLCAAFTTAFVSARAANPSLPVDAAQSLADTIESVATAPEGPAAALRAHGVAVSNDLGQATVTGLFGDIVAIDATDRWAEGSRPDALATEILDLAQRAARASDQFHRFIDEGDTHG